MKIGLSMTVRYCGHHSTQLRLGVFSPVGRDGRPPTLIRDGSENRTERERERGREKERRYREKHRIIEKQKHRKRSIIIVVLLVFLLTSTGACLQSKPGNWGKR